MVQIRQDVDIDASAETVFGVLADLRGYDAWLTGSRSYAGTVEVSGGTVGLGTTYTEPGPFGVRQGMVTEYEPPTRLTFGQPMTMKPRFLGTIGISVALELTELTPTSVHLSRVVTLTVDWPLKLVRPLVVRQFRTESERTLAALKEYAESGRTA